MNVVQKVQQGLLMGKALVSFARLTRDPDELDQVFEIADALSKASPELLQVMVDHFRQNPIGARAFQEKKRIVIDLAALSRLPEGSLGRVYADHMKANGLDPSAHPSLEVKSD